MSELSKAITKFMSKRNFNDTFKYSSFTENTVRNLLNSLSKEYGDDQLDAAQMEYAIRETVMTYSSSKSSAVVIIKKFLDFLKKEYGFNAQITFPPIDISNTFERMMFIAKRLQDPEYKIDSLTNELWVGQRTIEDDLARLRGNKEPIQILGKRFIIDETKRSKGRITFDSTAHPFFLTFNLTQVITTLKGLKAMCEEPALKNYAMVSAVSIWQQLSEYAKNRILYVMENLIPDDISWYKGLESSDEKMFRTEYQCGSTEGPGVLMDCLKNGKLCFVEYQNEEGDIQFLTSCRIVPRSYDGNGVEVDCDQGVKRLHFDQVLKSAYTEEELF
ncbi:MAG TPA: hypothetical protein VK861_05630 [Bacteroidales bacterium]|nr:hypothetical protein [Bacteroidales bacterium]